MTNFHLCPIALVRCALLAVIGLTQSGCGGGGSAEDAPVAAASAAAAATEAALEAPPALDSTGTAASAPTTTDASAQASPAQDPAATDLASSAASDQPVLADFVSAPPAVMATALAAVRTVPIQSADIIFNVNSTSSLASRGGQLQCLGASWNLSTLSAPVVSQGGAVRNEIKYSWVQDPAGSAKPVTYFAVRNTDVDTAGTGNKRCENAFYSTGQFIPWDRDFWFTTAVRTASLAGTTDLQSVWQWHEKSSVSGLSPYLAAYVYGSTMFIHALSNENSTMTSANTSGTVLYTINNWTPNTWYQFTVQARLDSKYNSSSYVRIWLNGVQVVSRVGPLGYVYANPQDYVKNGIYHWTGLGNPWQTAVTKREAWFKGPAMVLHRGGYAADTVSALIK